MVLVRKIYQIHILCRWRQDGYGISLKFITFATLMFKNTESLGLQMHGKEKTWQRYNGACSEHIQNAYFLSWAQAGNRKISNLQHLQYSFSKKDAENILRKIERCFFEMYTRCIYLGHGASCKWNNSQINNIGSTLVRKP